MKIESLRSKLKGAIVLAEKMVGRNLTLPVLGCIVLEAKDRHLFVRSTNLDIGLEISVPVKVERGGMVAIKSGVLGGLLSGFSADDKIVLELVDNQLLVRTKGHKIAIKTEPASDFPSIPRLAKDARSFVMPAENLSVGFRSVIYAASTSNIKPEIASVYIHQHDGDLVTVATDSFRLAERRLPLEKKSGLDLSAIIPMRNAIELIRVLENFNQVSFLVSYDKNQISFSSDGLYFTSRLIDGLYPDYQQIIPKTSKMEFELLYRDLQETTRLIGVFLDRLNKVSLKIRPADGLVEIKAVGETGEDVAQLEATIRGQGDWEINFNLKYLLEALPAITSEKIIFKFNEPNRPMVVRGAGDQSFTYLIMPLSQ